ncbi:MAG: hypothetical protein ACOYOL_09140 [Chthoniobacterales bacterium]|jgi:hypothetical protein
MLKLILRILAFPLAALALGAATQVWHPEGLWHAETSSPPETEKTETSPP